MENIFTLEEQQAILEATQSYIDAAVANEGPTCSLLDTPLGLVAASAIHDAQVANFEQ